MVGHNDTMMVCNFVFKCQKGTELEVVQAMHQSIPIAMGLCQGDPDNHCCEGRVRAIIAQEN